MIVVMVLVLLLFDKFIPTLSIQSFRYYSSRIDILYVKRCHGCRERDIRDLSQYISLYCQV